MKILIITKRQYTNKDLLDDQYGRLWEIPLHLAALGHQIKGICLSYRSKEKNNHFRSKNKQLEWYSFNIFSEFLLYFFKLHKFINSFKPEIILASSDCYHIILGYFLAKLYKIPCILDIYDNYEYFKASALPGVKPLYHRALKKANAISCSSKPLKHKLLQEYQTTGLIAVIENAVDTALFKPQKQKLCRAYFGLPNNIKIIGTAGALQQSRGIQNLYSAFEILAQQDDCVHLAVAGNGSRKNSVFQHPKIHDFGVLDYQDIPLFLGMLDVAVICNSNNGFGHYCYPQKANEILACNVPLIAADVGVMHALLSEYPECLFNANEFTGIAEKIKRQIVKPSILKIKVHTWKTQAESLEKIIRSVVSKTKFS